MDSKYLIKYSTFDDLLNEVRDDFEQLEAEGYIDSSKLIRVVKTINKKLGLKLHKDKQQIITVSNYKAKLPNDFYKLNFGLLCFSYKTIESKIEGRYTEEFWIQMGCENVPDSRSLTISDKFLDIADVYFGDNGHPYTILERKRNEIREYTHTSLCKIKATGSSYLSDSCISGSKDEITIQDDYIYTNFEEGELFISYIADLIDEDNNLLILDHPMVNEYYEYAVKRRILENMMLDGNEEVMNKLNFIEQRYREAKKTAHRLVDTPEFNELEEIWRLNRRNYHNKYYRLING